MLLKIGFLWALLRKASVNNFYAYSLHRELLEKNIRFYSAFVKGAVLDIGSKNRRYDAFFKNAKTISALDIRPEKGKGVLAGDARELPFQTDSFDTVISFETLEYVLDTQRALAEISRVLKDEGFFLFSIPFLNPIHGDVDNVRYTEKSLRLLLDEHFEIKKFVSFGGRYTLIWDFFFERIRNYSGRLKKALLLAPLFILKKLAVLLDKRERSLRFPMGYFCICQKKELP